MSESLKRLWSGLVVLFVINFLMGLSLAPAPASLELRGAESHSAEAPAGADVLARWPGPQVSVTFVNCPATLNCASAQRTVRAALKTWDDLIELDFVEVPQGGDVQIRWATGAVTSSTVFDGRGGVLAYGVPPYTWSALSGDLLFDDAEGWAVNQASYSYPDTIDLYAVALHEIGHVLGLNHLSDPSSVMHSAYSPRKGLSPSDIALIQQTYGAERGALPAAAMALVSRTVTLRESSTRNAAPVAELPAGSSVTVLQWGQEFSRVQAGEMQGWLPTVWLQLPPS